MYADMRSQIRRQKKRFRTLGTLEGLFAGMRSHVTVQMTGLSIGFEAMRALEGPFAGVNATVSQKMTGLRCVILKENHDTIYCQ